MLGGYSPRVSWVSAHLVSRATDCLCCGLSFGGCSYSEQIALEDRASVSLQNKGQPCLLMSMKDLGPLHSGSFSREAPYSMWRCYLALFPFHFGKWELKNQHKGWYFDYSYCWKPSFFCDQESYVLCQLHATVSGQPVSLKVELNLRLFTVLSKRGTFNTKVGLFITTKRSRKMKNKKRPWFNDTIQQFWKFWSSYSNYWGSQRAFLYVGYHYWYLMC